MKRGEEVEAKHAQLFGLLTPARDLELHVSDGAAAWTVTEASLALGSWLVGGAGVT